MNSFRFRLHAAITLSVLLCISFVPAARAASWFVDAAATGSHNGTSWVNAWTSFAQIAQASLSPDDVVWINAGTYNERFAIAKSGTSGHRITYIGAGGSAKPVLRGINGGAFTDIAIINLEFTQLSTANNYAVFTWAGATRWLIEDCNIHDTFLDGITGTNSPLSSYNIVRHNTFNNINGIDGGSGTGAIYYAPGDHNLVEYNTVLLSQDRIHFFGLGNVGRNNYFGYTDSALYPKSTVFPVHIDGFQSFDGVTGAPLVQFLWDRNYNVDESDTIGGNAHGLLIQNYTMTGLFKWAVMRFNIIIRMGGGAYSFRSFNQSYGYNNTSIQINTFSSSNFNNIVGYEEGTVPSDQAYWRNNSFSYDPKNLDGVFYIGTLTNLTTDYNHTYNTGPLPAASHNLLNVAPLFTDGTGVAGHDDYTLQIGSPLKGAGGPITSASGAGSSSTSLTVVDAKVLFDGWGIADADWVRIGAAGTLVQIASINYSTNVVTLTAARTWSNGDGVYVKGNEDIGALPYAYAKSFTVANTTPALHAGSNTLSATVNNPDAVRMVEFLVDGIPVGLAYYDPINANYAANCTLDGNPHTLNVRAYSAWASATLAVEAGGPPSNAKIGITVGP